MAGSDPTARLVLNLDGNVDTAGKAQAEQLEKLRATMRADADEIQNLRKALGILKGTTGTSAEEAKKLKEALVAKREATAAAQAKFLGLGGTLDQLWGKEKKQELETVKSTKELTGMRAELTKVSPAMVKLTKDYTAAQGVWIASAASLVLLVGSLAAVTAGTVAASGALVRYGLAAADAARNERLLLEGMIRTRGPLEGSEKMALGFQKAIDRVSADVPLARAEVVDLSKELWGMRLRGDALEKMLRGLALAKSVGQNFWALGYATNMTGKSMLELAKIAEQRWGPVVAKQMFSISVQSTKLKEQLKSLFAGVDVAPLGMLLKSVTDQFRESTVLGWDLRRALEALFKPFLGDAAKASELVPAVMQEIAIHALMLEDKVLDLAIAAKKWWLAGGDEVAGRKAQAILGDLKVVAEGVAQALHAAAVAAEFFLSALSVPQEMFDIDDAKLNAQARARAGGKQVAQGFAEGMTSEKALVAAASGALALVTAGVFQNALKMHSPSRLFFDFGVNISRSTGLGIRAAAPEAQRAAADIIRVQALPPVSMPAVAPGGRGGHTFNGPITIPIQGGSGSPQDIATAVKGVVELLLEGVVVEIGAMPAPQGARP